MRAWIGVLLIGGCQGESAPDGEDVRFDPSPEPFERAGVAGDGMGTLRVQLHDAPTDDVSEVWVTFDEITARHEIDGWVVVSSAMQSVELLSLQDGVVEELGVAELPIGSYSELRLHLTDAHVVLLDGSEAPLDVPSGMTSGVKLKGDFELFDCGDTVLDLDWDAGAHLTVNPQGYKLRPTLQLDAASTEQSCTTGPADINGDGVPELLVSGRTPPLYDGGRILAYEADSAGQFQLTGETMEAPPNSGGHAFGGGLNVGDVNGDGFTDVLMSEWFDNDGVHLFLGGPSGLEATPVQTWGSPDGTTNYYGWDQGVGDVNGDGITDLVLSSVGAVYVHLGNGSGFDETPLSTTIGPEFPVTIGAFGFHIAVGDVDGDGAADVAVAAMNENVFRGRVYIYMGGSTGLGATPDLVLNPTSTVQYAKLFGSGVAMGDFNADGLADLAVGRPSPGTGGAAVFYGTPSGLPTIADQLLSVAGTALFGAKVRNIGDTTGDGIDDLSITDRDSINDTTFQAYIFAGGATGLGDLPVSSLEASFAAPIGLSYFSNSPNVVGIGDLDGDGAWEVAVSQPYPDGTNKGVVHIYDGGLMGTQTVPRQIIDGPTPAGTDVSATILIGYQYGAH